MQPCEPQSSKPRAVGLQLGESALRHEWGGGGEQNMPDRFSLNAGKLTVRHRASDYRLMASMCLEIANQMSLHADRTRMTDMAQKWLDLAQTSQAEELRSGQLATDA